MAKRTNHTTAEDYLVRHATEYVWQSPYEDANYILKMARLTDRDGAVNEVEIFDNGYYLPSKQKSYHVFMLGGNLPSQFGLQDTCYGSWVNMLEYCNEHDFILKAYNEKGILIPLHNIYHLVEEDGNNLFAIKEEGEYGIDLGREDIFFQFRASHFWSVQTDTHTGERINLQSQFCTKAADITKMSVDFSRYLNIKERKGSVLKQNPRYPLAFINGRPTGGYTNAKVADEIMLIDDGSALFVDYFRVSDLRTFQSDLDKCNKYLVYLQNQDQSPYADSRSIHYRDDIEIYLVKHDTNAREQRRQSWIDSTREFNATQEVLTGCYYHRNREDSVRMVTHRSFSVPTDYIHSMIQFHDEHLDLDNWYLKVVVKASGLPQKLVTERHHVNGLEQLPYQDRINTMVDTKSTIPEWTAAELEKSSYNYLMRARTPEIDVDRVIDAYGYSQMALALANPNVSVTRENGQLYFIIPVTISRMATIYEYDKYGVLLGWYHHKGGATRYHPVHGEKTIFIEAIGGKGDGHPLVYHNTPSFTTVNATARIYKADKDGFGVVSGKYKDITFDTTQVTYHEYINPDKQVIREYAINLNKDEDYLAILDNEFISRNLRLPPDRFGIYQFSITHGSNHQLMRIPFAMVSVWVDGHALIEGIDYLVNDSTVTIISRKYIENKDAILNVTYRCVGFVSQDMIRPKPREVGFVINGKLSVDHHYDLHQNKISHLVIGGGTYNPHLLTFDDKYGEAEVNVPDGTPYMIEDHVISAGYISGLNLQDALEKERELTERIRTFMSSFTHDPDHVPDKALIKTEYEVYSPFLTAVIHYMLLNEEKYKEVNWRNKSEIIKVATPFQFLLEQDPAYLGCDIDFIRVLPLPYIPDNPITIHHRLYGILEALVSQYFKVDVDLNHYFKVIRTRTKKAN